MVILLRSKVAQHPGLCVQHNFATLRAVSKQTNPEILLLQRSLAARRGSYHAIVDATGISYSWLSKFASGHICNPTFARVEQLRKYLLSTPA